MATGFEPHQCCTSHFVPFSANVETPILLVGLNRDHTWENDRNPPSINENQLSTIDRGELSVLLVGGGGILSHDPTDPAKQAGLPQPTHVCQGACGCSSLRIHEASGLPSAVKSQPEDQLEHKSC